mmetsp:Transcript_151770/g.486974  ORF Transcript_151770/g.486974 Transcript_151770/m.486974 type:complete len:271 (-) Transcript_151770:496-1308(-)
MTPSLVPRAKPQRVANRPLESEKALEVCIRVCESRRNSGRDSQSWSKVHWRSASCCQTVTSDSLGGCFASPRVAASRAMTATGSSKPLNNCRARVEQALAHMRRMRQRASAAEQNTAMCSKAPRSDSASESGSKPSETTAMSRVRLKSCSLPRTSRWLCSGRAVTATLSPEFQYGWSASHNCLHVIGFVPHWSQRRSYKPLNGIGHRTCNRKRRPSTIVRRCEEDHRWITNFPSHTELAPVIAKTRLQPRSGEQMQVMLRTQSAPVPKPQ